MFNLQDEFATDEFIKLNKHFYDKFIDMRVRGVSAQQAFIRTFGADHWPSGQHGHLRLEAMEATQYFQEQFNAKLEAIKIDDLWNTKLSVNEFLQIMKNPHTRDSTRLAAAKELNILVGITVVDENGKTKAGRTLNDFYVLSGAATTEATEPEPKQP